MTEAEFRQKAKEYGYDDEEIEGLIETFVKEPIELGIPPTPYDEIIIWYKNY